MAATHILAGIMDALVELSSDNDDDNEDDSIQGSIGGSSTREEVAPGVTAGGILNHKIPL